ncbi:hypothetical protein LZ554_007624 [Drepanopeziza brunnea f. sp. 'monogermtubi']|nr:hypothetical protein LZ554_007624 [Drepanopeziza brunnea f. sp. 'monogermtubi']
MSGNLPAGDLYLAEIKKRARCQVPIHLNLHYDPSAHIISVSAATNTASAGVASAAQGCVILVKAPVQPEPIASATVQPEPVAQTWDTYVPFSFQPKKLAPATARPEPVAQTWDTYVPFSDQFKPAAQSLDVRAPATIQPKPVAHVRAPATVQPKPVAQTWDTYVPFSDQPKKLAPATARPEPVAQTWDTYVPFSDQFKPAAQSLDVRAPATVQPKPVAHVLAPVTVEPKKWDYDEGRQWANLNLRVPRSQLAYAKSIEPFIIDNRLADIPYELLINKAQSDGEVGAVFEFFPILPGELRNKIWGYAAINQLKSERTIRIEILGDGFDGNIPRIVNRSRPIALLNTSRDARAITMPFYEQTFVTGVPNPNYIFFNHENDRVFVNTPRYIDFDLFICCLPLDERARIQHMAITVKELQRSKQQVRAGGVVGKICDYFPGLKTLTMIAGDARIDGPYTRHVTRHSVRAEFRRYQLGWDPSRQNVPEVNGEMVPALLARRWDVDNLPYCGAAFRH